MGTRLPLLLRTDVRAGERTDMCSRGSLAPKTRSKQTSLFFGEHKLDEQTIISNNYMHNIGFPTKKTNFSRTNSVFVCSIDDCSLEL